MRRCMSAEGGRGEMAKYRKKPLVIEAIQWFEVGDHTAVRHFNPAFRDSICEKCKTVKHAHGFVDTLEGGHIVCPGDWIITGVQGEHYPCKPDIFKATYESVSD